MQPVWCDEIAQREIEMQELCKIWMQDNLLRLFPLGDPRSRSVVSEKREELEPIFRRKVLWRPILYGVSRDRFD